MRVILTLLLVFLFTPLAEAQASCKLPIKTPYSVVMLLNGNLLDRIYGGLLAELCTENGINCVIKTLSEQPVYDAPSGKEIATLRVLVKPQEGLSAEIVKDGQVFPFKPTVYDPDWGYTVWFHSTMLDQKGDWKKIPFPHIESGWINIPNIENSVSAQIYEITTERDWKNYAYHEVYTFKDRYIVIIKKSPSGLTIRDEQPIDTGCISDALPLTKFKKEFIPLNKLYDDSCNLLVAKAYPRGC